MVRRVVVSDPGGKTPGVPLPFDAHPGDRDPVHGVERVTFQRRRAPTQRQNDDHRFALHAPTLAPVGVTGVTISSRVASNSGEAQ